MNVMTFDIATLDLATCRVLLQAALQRCNNLEEQLVTLKGRGIDAGERTAPANTVDLLTGYEAIGAFLGLNAQQVKHRCRKGLLPIFYQGRTPCATKSGLQVHLNTQMSVAKGGR